MEAITEKNKPIRVALIKGDNEFLDLSILVDKIAHHQGEEVNQVASGIEATIISFTVPINQELRLETEAVSCTASFKWQLTRNGVYVDGGYLNVGVADMQRNYRNGYILFESGDDLILAVEHGNELPQRFRASISGYLLNI